MADKAFKFEMNGMKELMSAMEQLPTVSMKKAVVRNALKKAAKPVKAAAKLNAAGIPVKNDKITDSIKISTSVKKSQRGRRDRSRVTVYVGSSHPLSHLFEFGTAARYNKKGAYRGYIPPMPFMRSAWDSNKKISLSLLREELWKALQKSARLLAKKSMKGTLTKGQRRGLLR